MLAGRRNFCALTQHANPRCYSCSTVSFRGADKPSRWSRRQSVIAIVAVLSLLSAGLGFRALQIDIATDSTQSAAATFAVIPAAGPAQLQDASTSARQLDLGSPSEDKAVKGAGLRRDRATTLSVCESRWSWSPSPVARVVDTEPRADVRSRAPAIVLTGQDLLTQLCVARR